MTDDDDNIKLKSALVALRSYVSAAQAELEKIEKQLAERSPLSDEQLGVDQTLKEYGVGRDGLLQAAARGEISLTRGPRQRILVERREIERWLRSRPVAAKLRRRKTESNVVDLATWEKETERELRSLGGRS